MHRAGVAKMVEQRIRNAKVEGSIPFTGTIHLPDQFLSGLQRPNLLERFCEFVFGNSRIVVKL